MIGWRSLSQPYHHAPQTWRWGSPDRCPSTRSWAGCTAWTHTLGSWKRFGNKEKRILIIKVLRICANLVWIRIRGSVTLTKGSGFGSCFLRLWLRRCQKKFFFKDFLLLLLKVHLHQSSTVKSQKSNKKYYKSRFSYLFLLVDARIQIRANNDGSWRPKNIRIHNTAHKILIQSLIKQKLYIARWTQF